VLTDRSTGAFPIGGKARALPARLILSDPLATAITITFRSADHPPECGSSDREPAAERTARRCDQRSRDRLHS
jgi:hypothetical protein